MGDHSKRKEWYRIKREHLKENKERILQPYKQMLYNIMQ